MPKMFESLNYLKSLNIELNSTGIQSEGLEMLAFSLGKCHKFIEIFKLNLKKNNIDENGVKWVCDAI